MLLMACGQIDQQPLAGLAGKADHEGNSKFTWSDGKQTRGKYTKVWTEWFTPQIIDRLNEHNDLPGANFGRLLDKPELFYSIEAYAWDDTGKGHLSFVVPSDDLPVRLGPDSFWLKVRMDEDLPAGSYDLALLKFYRQGGEEKYSSVVVPLEEAMAGRLVTVNDESDHAPELFDVLQRSGDAPDRVGLAGTWKAIVVPRKSNPTVDTVKGDTSVQFRRIWIVAGLAPVYAPQHPDKGFMKIHNEIARDLNDAATLGRSDATSENFRRLEQAADRLNNYLDPECGIFKIVSPGAMAWMVNSDDFTPDMLEHNFFIRSSYTDPELWYLTPDYICLAEEWNRSGNVMANVANYTRLTRLQKYMGQEEGFPSGFEYDQKLQRCQAKISLSVTNTEDSVTLSYGLVDGQWRLIVIDLTTACDA